MAAMLTVLNKRWLSMGWRAMDKADSEPMALVWIEQLDNEKVPHTAYYELYSRSVGLRARRFEQGLKADDFSVDMMIACWPALRTELRQREIDAGRTLGANAASVCQRCDGSGWRPVEGADAVTKCDHN